MPTKWSVALAAFATVLATPVFAERDAPHYTSLTVFGDSLVDAGNFYIYKTTTTSDPVPDYFLPDPSLGYANGRFTNGYDYPDLLSIDLFGVPTTPSLAGGNNFAYGGARIVDTGDNIPDLQAQINAFERSGRSVDPNGLYILNFGANDVFGAEGALPVNGLGSYPDVDSYLQAAADQYVAGIQALNDLGVRNILITDFPLAGDPLTDEANEDLSAALAKLKLDSGTDLMVYSLSNFNVRVLSDPASFGLPAQRLDTTCIEAGAQATGCAGIFSFDGIHPTAAIQAAGYNDINKQFGLTSGVPEPITWALMCAGFGAIGIVLRSRHRPTSDRKPALGAWSGRNDVQYRGHSPSIENTPNDELFVRVHVCGGATIANASRSPASLRSGSSRPPNFSLGLVAAKEPVDVRDRPHTEPPPRWWIAIAIAETER